MFDIDPGCGTVHFRFHRLNGRDFTRFYPFRRGLKNFIRQIQQFFHEGQAFLGKQHIHECQPRTGHYIRPCHLIIPLCQITTQNRMSTPFGAFSAQFDQLAQLHRGLGRIKAFKYP